MDNRKTEYLRCMVLEEMQIYPNAVVSNSVWDYFNIIPILSSKYCLFMIMLHQIRSIYTVEFMCKMLSSNNTFGSRETSK